MKEQGHWKELLKHREITFGCMGISRFDYDVLVFIGANPSTTIKEIVSSTLFGGSTLSTVKRTIERFKAKGWLNIINNADDGRERLIMLDTEHETIMMTTEQRAILAKLQEVTLTEKDTNMKKQYYISFYKANPWGRLSRMISFWKDSHVTHAEFVLELGTHTVKSKCFSSEEGLGVRFKSINIHNGKWITLKIPFLLDEEEIKNYMMLYDGKKYDWKGILLSHVFGSMRQNRDKWFCSELCSKMCGFTNPQRYDPQALKDILDDIARINRKQGE